MKPFYKKGFTEEGILWRKGNAVVFKPTDNIPYWKVRIVGGKEGKPLEEGEGDFYKTNEHKAFRSASKLARKLKKSKP